MSRSEEIKEAERLNKVLVESVEFQLFALKAWLQVVLTPAQYGERYLVRVGEARFY
jgi:hypothetical protein